MFQRIPGNVEEDSRECSRRFRGMFEEILGNVQEDSVECSKRFRVMFEEIPGNAQEDFGESNFRLFCEILFIFYQILQLNCEKIK